MKKIAIIFLSAVLFICFSVCVCADIVTTTPQEGTQANTAPEGYEDGLVREADISAPITACIVAVCGFIIYGAVKIKKAKKDELEI